MLLALDIGNTNIKIGVFDDADSNGYSPAATWRISSDRKRMTFLRMSTPPRCWACWRWAATPPRMSAQPPFAAACRH